MQIHRNTTTEVKREWQQSQWAYSKNTHVILLMSRASIIITGSRKQSRLSWDHSSYKEGEGNQDDCVFILF
jgi:hypothetical protein